MIEDLQIDSELKFPIFVAEGDDIGYFIDCSGITSYLEHYDVGVYDAFDRNGRSIVLYVERNNSRPEVKARYPNPNEEIKAPQTTLWELLARNRVISHDEKISDVSHRSLEELVHLFMCEHKPDASRTLPSKDSWIDRLGSFLRQILK